MLSLDFLPPDYRRTRTVRRGRSWQILVLLLGFALMLAIGIVQASILRHLQSRLAEMEPERLTIEAQASALVRLQEQLRFRRADAELFTYLRHPWHKTQLLAAVLHNLPESITFHRLEISSQSVSTTPLTRRNETDEAELAALPPASRDLKRLRKEYDTRELVVLLQGKTTDEIACHRYLDSLNDVCLFDRVELRSLELERSEHGNRFQFEAAVTVLPGYFQPDGPSTPLKEVSWLASLASPSEGDPSRP